MAISSKQRKTFAAEIREQADEKAKKAEKRIHDWMVEANYSAEMRKVLHDASRIGVGVLMAPFAESRTKSSGISRRRRGCLADCRASSPACRGLILGICFLILRAARMFILATSSLSGISSRRES